MERPRPVEGGATITLKELSELYFISDEFKTLNPNSQTAYRGDLKRFRGAIDLANTLDISVISQKTIKDYLDQLKSSTANRRLAALRQFFIWAVENQLAYSDTTRKIPYFQVDKKTTMDYLTNQEIQNLLTASRRNPRDAAFIVIALRTGANVSEIVALRRDNIRFNGQLVTIQFPPKRLFELNRDDSAIITDHIENIPENSYIFTRKSEDRPPDHLSRQGVSLILTRYASVVGKPLSARTLRHTFIMNFEGGGGSLSRTLGYRHRNQAWLMLARRELTNPLASRKNQTPHIPEP